MTTGNAGQDTAIEEQAEQDEREGEAAFAAGFKKTIKAETAATAKPTSGEQPDAGQSAEQKAADEAEAKAKSEAEAKAKAETAAKDALERKATDERKFLDALPSRLRNLEGHLGGINSKLESVLATAKAAAKTAGTEAPSEQQIQAAMSSPDAWKKLEEDFPDWAAPVKAEFAAVRKELAAAVAAGKPVDVDNLRQTIAGDVDQRIASARAEAEESAFLRMKHPDWKSTVNTPEFMTWSLDGGPSREQFAEMKALERTDPAKADAMVNQFSRDFPKWWGDRGAAIFDAAADKAIQLLDGFKEHKAKTASAEQTRLKQEKRLAGALTPKGTSSPPTGIDDEAAFDQGFNRVRKAKH